MGQTIAYSKKSTNLKKTNEQKNGKKQKANQHNPKNTKAK